MKSDSIWNQCFNRVVSTPFPLILGMSPKSYLYIHVAQTDYNISLMYLATFSAIGTLWSMVALVYIDCDQKAYVLTDAKAMRSLRFINFHNRFPPLFWFRGSPCFHKLISRFVRDLYRISSQSIISHVSCVGK